MFSDTIFDAIQQILDDLRPEYAFSDVYPKEEVIKMLTQMHYLVALSDGMMPNGTYNNSKEEMYKLCEKKAREEYEAKMNEIILLK